MSSSSRFNSSRFAALREEDEGAKKEKKEKPKEQESNNALWRVPTWFPELDPSVLRTLHEYHQELLRFNSRLSLISKGTERDADEAHFADAVLAYFVMRRFKFAGPIYDLGSGNGFPGMVFAIMDPKRKYMLVDSDVRKCEFLKHMSFHLKLQNVEVLNVRLESLANAGMEVAVTRGFASLSKTLLSSNKLFKKGGQFFHLKGNSWSTEVAELPSQIISTWTPELAGDYSLPVSQIRRSVVYTKKT